MHSDPAVRSVAGVSGYTRRAGNVDDLRDKTVVAFTVDGRWEAHDRRAQPLRGQRQRRDFHETRDRRRIDIYRVFLRHRASRCKTSGSGAHDQWAIRPGEYRANRLNRVPIGGCGCRIIGKIVNEGGIHHTVRGRRAAAQTVKIFE